MTTALDIVVLGLAYLLVGAGFACVMSRTRFGCRLRGFLGLNMYDDVEDMFTVIVGWPLITIALVAFAIAAFVVAVVLLVFSPAYLLAVLLSRLFDRLDRRRH